MKQIYLSLETRIKSQIPEIRWVDIDYAQMDIEGRPAVLCPAVLLDIGFPSSEQIGGTACEKSVTILARLFVEPIGATNSQAPATQKAMGLAVFDLVDKLYNALQNYSDGFTSLEHQSTVPEQRADGYKCYNLTFTSRKIVQ